MSVVEENPLLDYWRTYQKDDNLTELFSLEDEDFTTASRHHAWDTENERYETT